MPDHAAKRKNFLHNTGSNVKSVVHQDEKSSKDHEVGQKQPPLDAEEPRKDDASSIDLTENGSENFTEEDYKEPPKPPYDAMRVEPVLTNLIVEKYEGEVDEHGFFEGDASIYFVGGHWYKGPIRDKKMNGNGVYCWADGTVYRGEFSDNSISGIGMYSWPDGSMYEGEVKNGLRHGIGTYKCGTCPSMYNGDWVNGKRHGKGVLYFDLNCESYYDGEWKNGIKDGNGVHKYRSGNVYEGRWMDNMRHGKGTMHWFDRGEEYEGEWVKGIQNGNGKHVWYSKRVTVSQYPIRNEYEGNFIDGQRHGFGVFRYASGAKYSGYWKKNLKSGKGEFMFKNGSIFKGMFENDHIVDYPDLIPSGMTTPEIAESGLTVRSQTPLHRPSPAVDIGSVDAQLDINLSGIFVEERFDIERQQIELEELKRVVLRFMTPMKHIYKFYSSLGILENTDNTYVMNRMQFWRFLKDCMLHTVGCTLAEIDFADGISESRDDAHDPNTQIYVRDFVNVLINISYLLFKDEFPNERCAIAGCMLKMLAKFVLPNACSVKGNVFRTQEVTKEALKYIQKCDEIFTYFRKASNKYDTRNALRIRDFLWMLKDLKLINSSLSVSTFLDAVYSEDQAMLEDRCFNLENNVVFLEFFETLLTCSQHFTTESSKTDEENENTKNAVVDAADMKSPTLTKDEEESVNADGFFEQQRSPISAQSPDKSTTLVAETGSSLDQLKHEPTQSPSKTHESTSHGKASAAGGSRKEHHGTKESGSVAGGSRGKRRGTIDNTETDGKATNASSSKVKEKGTKEKEKSKSGGKSAKKVLIEEGKEKNIAASTSVHYNMEQEHESQSVVQLEVSPAGADESSNQQSNNNLSESDAGIVAERIFSDMTDDLARIKEENIEKYVDDSNLNTYKAIHGAENDNAVTGERYDGNDEKFQLWASNLRTFLEDNFFPAFQLRKKIEEVLEEERTSLLIN